MLYVSEALGILFWGFGLIVPALVCFSAIGVETIVLFLANPNENRDYISNNMVGKAQRIQLFRRRKVGPESLFDRDGVYRKVQSAVITMSKQKVGAIISFEKKDSLDEVMKSGTRIDAPVSAELLQTIFYPGTRLHDGAVIIRENRIMAAGCLLPLTSDRSLSTELGTRHRAAIGISELAGTISRASRYSPSLAFRPAFSQNESGMLYAMPSRAGIHSPSLGLGRFGLLHLPLAVSIPVLSAPALLASKASLPLM